MGRKTGYHREVMRWRDEVQATFWGLWVWRMNRANFPLLAKHWQCSLSEMG